MPESVRAPRRGAAVLLVFALASAFGLAGTLETARVVAITQAFKSTNAVANSISNRLPQISIAPSVRRDEDARERSTDLLARLAAAVVLALLAAAVLLQRRSAIRSFHRVLLPVRHRGPPVLRTAR